MASTLICVRHAQGLHNLGNYDLQDPKLTELGEEQCAAIANGELVDQSKIGLVTASPLTRTIATAYLSFGPALKNGKCKKEIIALPDAQETSDFKCDTGSDLAELKRRCDAYHWPVDLSQVHEDWNVKTSGSRYSPRGESVKARVQTLRQQLRGYLQELSEGGDQSPVVVLVAHGAVLHYITNDWEDSNKYIGTGWLNTETREYTFVEGVDSKDEEAAIQETVESRSRRGKTTPAFDRNEQAKHYISSHDGWESQGLVNALKI